MEDVEVFARYEDFRPTGTPFTTADKIVREDPSIPYEAALEIASRANRAAETSPAVFRPAEIGTIARNDAGEFYILAEVALDDFVQVEGTDQRNPVVEKYADWLLRPGHQVLPVDGVQNILALDGKVRLNDGHHRISAARMVGMSHYPVWVNLTDPANNARPATTIEAARAAIEILVAVGARVTAKPEADQAAAETTPKEPWERTQKSLLGKIDKVNESAANWDEEGFLLSRPEYIAVGGVIHRSRDFNFGYMFGEPNTDNIKAHYEYSLGKGAGEDEGRYFLLAETVADDGRRQEDGAVGEYAGTGNGIMASHRGLGAGRAFFKELMNKGIWKPEGLGYSPGGLAVVKSAHKSIIRDALDAGKPVPAEVLADYPELQAEHMAPNGRPFKTKSAAENYRVEKNLDVTHTISPTTRIIDGKYADGYVVNLRRARPSQPGETALLPANLGPLYRDWIAKDDYRISAAPSDETLAKYRQWAEDILAGKSPVSKPEDFKRFMRLREYGKKFGIDLRATYTAFNNGQDITPDGGLKTIKPASSLPALDPAQSQAFDDAEANLDRVAPTIKTGKDVAAGPNLIYMNARNLARSEQTTRLSAPYDGTEADALRVAKGLKLHAALEYDASMRESEVFGTDAASNPVYAFTQGQGVTEIQRRTDAPALQGGEAAAPDATPDDIFTREVPADFGPVKFDRSAAERAKELPRNSIVLSVATRPNGRQWHTAFVSTGGDFDMVEIGASRAEFSRQKILAEIADRATRKKERQSKNEKARLERVAKAESVGIQKGAEWQNATAYVQGKGKVTYDRAKVLSYDAIEGIAVIEVYRRGMRAPERFSVDAFSRFFENYAPPARPVLGETASEAPASLPAQDRKAAAEKKPWKMTKDEFRASIKIEESPGEGKFKAVFLDKNGNPTEMHIVRKEGVDPVEQVMGYDYHESYIQSALREGKPVPVEVLADYPEKQVAAAKIPPGTFPGAPGAVLSGMNFAEFEKWVKDSFVAFRNQPVMRTGKGDKGLTRHLANVQKHAEIATALRNIGFKVSGFAPDTPTDARISEVFATLSANQPEQSVTAPSEAARPAKLEASGMAYSEKSGMWHWKSADAAPYRTITVKKWKGGFTVTTGGRFVGPLGDNALPAQEIGTFPTEEAAAEAVRAVFAEPVNQQSRKESPIKPGDVSVGDTVYFTDVRDETKRLPGNFRGFNGDQVVVVRDGQQMSLPKERVFKSEMTAAEQLRERPAALETDASLSRQRAREAVVFNTPYVGRTGASLVGYEWAWRPEEYIDATGEDRVKRVSDWEQSITNPETDREIVHQFIVLDNAGIEQTVSAESAAKLLGITAGAVRVNAKKLLETEIRKQKESAKKETEVRSIISAPKWPTPAEAFDAAIQEGRSFGPLWAKRKEWAGKPGSEFLGAEKETFLQSDDGYYFSPSYLNRPDGYQKVSFRRSEVWPVKADVAAVTEIIPSTPGLKIVNLAQLPRGTGARYLEVIRGQGDDLVAKQWRRLPVAGAILIDFEAAQPSPRNLGQDVPADGRLETVVGGETSQSDKPASYEDQQRAETVSEKLVRQKKEAVKVFGRLFKIAADKGFVEGGAETPRVTAADVERAVKGTSLDVYCLKSELIGTGILRDYSGPGPRQYNLTRVDVAEVNDAAEPWQMTREEFRSRIKIQNATVQGKFKAVFPDKNGNPTEMHIVRKEGVDPVEQVMGYDYHESYIQSALREGKPVPVEVLKDYPSKKEQAMTENKVEIKGVNLPPIPPDVEQSDGKYIPALVDKINQLYAEAATAGLTPVTVEDFMAGVNSGNRQGFSVEQIALSLQERRADLARVQNGTMQPRKVVGVGGTKKAAVKWLEEHIAKDKFSLETGGVGNSTNLRNYQFYLNGLLREGKDLSYVSNEQQRLDAEKAAEQDAKFRAEREALEQKAAASRKYEVGSLAGMKTPLTIQFTVPVSDIHTVAALADFQDPHEKFEYLAKRAAGDSYGVKQKDIQFNRRVDLNGALRRRGVKFEHFEIAPRKGYSVVSVTIDLDGKPREAVEVVTLPAAEKVETIAGPLTLADFEKEHDPLEPFQVTRTDWVNLQRAERRRLGQTEESGPPAAPFADYEEYHRQNVVEAIRNGNQVDHRVLVDYPDLLPPGWTESSPGGLACNPDPKNGGIIDNELVTGKWFVIFERKGLDRIEGLPSREAAFTAFHKAMATAKQPEVVIPAKMPGPKAPDQKIGAWTLALREENAATSFKSSAIEQFGLTPEEAKLALDYYLQHKLVSLDWVMGNFKLSDGRFWEEAPLRKAVALQQGQAPAVEYTVSTPGADGESFTDPVAAAKAFAGIPADRRPYVIKTTREIGVKLGNASRDQESGAVVANTTVATKDGRSTYGKFVTESDPVLAAAYRLEAPRPEWWGKVTRGSLFDKPGREEQEMEQPEQKRAAPGM